MQGVQKEHYSANLGSSCVIQGGAMTCVSCGSQSIDKFLTEIAIHVHSDDRRVPLVFVFPRILVCMDCGKLEIADEFAIPGDELRKLSRRAA